MWGGGVDSMKMWKRSILRPGGREGISERNLIVEIVHYSIHTDCRIPPVLSAAPPLCKAHVLKTAANPPVLSSDSGSRYRGTWLIRDTHTPRITTGP